MAKTIKVELSEDEIGMLIDALEADQEGYVEAAKEARANNKRDDVDTFTDAAMHITQADDAAAGPDRRRVSEWARRRRRARCRISPGWR